MTVRQIPQPCDVIATRALDRGSADNLHGVVLVARRGEPPQSAATDLSNVVPFARPRRQDATVAFPLPAVSEDDRSLPLAAKLGIVGVLTCMAASLMLHGALLAMFWQEPKPMASIGIEVMTVDIIVGGTTAAGIAKDNGEQETQPVLASEQRAEDEPVADESRVATVMPLDVPVAAVETAPEEQRPELEAAVVESTASTEAIEKPPEQTEQPRPPVQTVQQAPERKRTAAPTEKKSVQKKQVASVTPTDAASGVGRGRSDRSSNYPGIVRAHLVRYKQSPNGARGNGVATVAFTLDGSGRVTSVRLVSGSGVAAFDQEAVAMARRASPFPPPDDGKGKNFTIPVRFEVR
jgi:periplasmic protein TonB